MKISIVVGCFVLTAPILATHASERLRFEKEDVQAAAIRYQMEDWYRSGDENEVKAKNRTEKTVAKLMNFKVFFVAIDGKDLAAHSFDALGIFRGSSRRCPIQRSTEQG